jgi:hypothetical protein
MRLSYFGPLFLAAIAALGQTPCTPTVIGDLRVERFDSRTYGKSITVRVWLPAGYGQTAQINRKYPALYMFDGQTLFDECTAFKGEHELRFDETASSLISEGKIPPMIIIGVDSTGRRDYEYAPYKNPVTDASKPDPIGKQLPAFFGDELVPWVRERYRVTNDAGETGIGGTSLGAAAASHCSVRTCSDWLSSSRAQAYSWGTVNSYVTRHSWRALRTESQLVLEPQSLTSRTSTRTFRHTGSNERRRRLASQE